MHDAASVLILYVVQDGIWCLDVMNRPDRAAFDKNAFEECGVLMDSSIVDTVHFVARNRGNVQELAHMTDKHYFRESELAAAADQAGFASVRFVQYAKPKLYDIWMEGFLNIYGVTRPDVRKAAIAQYERVAAFAGPMLPDLMSHFKSIVLRKAGN